MSKFTDIDKVGESLRNLIDNNRCGICDKLGSVYWRCIHGHIVCNECCSKEEGCLTCFTIFNSPVVHNTWVIDKLQSDKVKNALNLLNTFQDAFKTDVYKRQRLSDQLKVEKELFPDCIQAPVKYSNKRKSLKSSFFGKNKENSQQPFYPGEQISSLKTVKMKKSNYVQQWLESNSTKSRKPFSNINVNNQTFSSGAVQDVRKKSSIKSIAVKNKFLNESKQLTKTDKNRKVGANTHSDKNLQSFFKSYKENVNTEYTVKDYLRLKNTSKVGWKDDSGIVMDEECITIEDTPTEIIDKDELALRAVHEAEKNEHSDYSTNDNVESRYTSKIKDKIKVVYKKRSLLYLSCPNCSSHAQNHKTSNISIAIEYGSSNEANVNKKSVAVQTDISEIFDTITSVELDKNNDELLTQKTTSEEDFVLGSQDVFMDDLEIFNENKKNDLSQNTKKIQVIDESDTDVESEHLQVAVEVHRACLPKDYEILSQLPLSEMMNRKRRAQRGATPGSSDSSEKENLDPNRIKRSKYTKKGKKKPKKS
ncbi:uncharacterized protein LOC106135393 [Amyelois transitella]|uniref:uncharacterized protein LOC106135393 n=1 Tax=Amyelois transitella TaxID=680683 RepID=UPI00298F7557|nr:uncharacterized protein LOC106135393 [Amyelois transitella]